MNSQIFLFVFIFYSLSSFNLNRSLAQSSKIDSLQKILLSHNKEDTNKVNTLNKLSWEFKNNYSDSTIYYGLKTISLAQKLNFPAGEAEALLCTGTGYYGKGEYGKGLDYFLKSNSIVDRLERSSQRKSNYKELKGKILLSIGATYFRQGDYTKALDYYFKNLKVCDELGDKNQIAIALGSVAITYRNQENFSKSLEYFQKVLKLRKEISDTKGIIGCLGNIGTVYDMQSDFPNALNYRLKALKFAEALGDKSILAENLGNTGIIYSKQAGELKTGSKDSVYEKAREYFSKALAITHELGNKNTTSIWLSSIGYSFYKQSLSEKQNTKKEKLLEQALEYDIQSLRLKEELGNKFSIATQLGSIGSVFIESKRYQEAEKYLLDAIKIEKEIGALEQQMNCETFLSELYEKSGKATLALEHFKNVMMLKDTLFNQENQKQMVRKEMNYEFEKKEAEAKAEQEINEAKAKAEAKKQQIILWSVAGGLLLVIFFAGFIFRSYTQIKKKNIEIAAQKKKVEEKQKEILDSIHYAARIQRSLLPTEKFIDKTLKRLMKK